MLPFGDVVSEVESMRWFRWYHDTAADTKHALIARRTGQSKTTVIAFWAYILETASKATPRGSLAELDIEEASVALEVDTEALESIHNEMQIKGLISNQEVTNWIKRQPSSDSTEAERARKYRESKKETKSSRDGHGKELDTEEETEYKTPSKSPKGDKAKRAFRLPDNWEPSVENLEWAKTEHPAVDAKWQTVMFKNHFLANGKVMVSWDRAWQNWIARALSYSRPNPLCTPKLVAKSKNQTILEAWKDGKQLRHKPSGRTVTFEEIEPFNHLAQRVTEDNPTAFKSKASGNVAFFVDFEVID